MRTANPKRDRRLYAALIVTTVLVAVSTRRRPDLYPGFVERYGGDTLWALTAFWMLGFLWNRLGTRSAFGLSLAFAFGIETSQLFHPAWLEAVRNTTLGGYVLGFGFLWSDLICYMVGAAVGALAETLTFGALGRRSPRRS